MAAIAIGAPAIGATTIGDRVPTACI